jgi:predicted PurR-regulated permease PerM
VHARRDPVTPVTHTPILAPQARIVLQVLLVIVGVAFGFWALYKLASVVFVLIVAALFAYVVAPLVHLAERPIPVAGRPRHLSRGPAIALVYLLIAGGVAAGAAVLLPSATEQVNDMMTRAPSYAQSFVTWKHGWSRYYQRLRLPIELRHSIDESVTAVGETGIESARSSLLTVIGALTNLPWLLLIPIFAFFFLKDAASFRRTIVRALPPPHRLRGDGLLEELNTTLAAYVRAQLLACVLIGTICGIGFALLGIPYPVLLGVLAGVLEFIPLIGPLVLVTVASIVAALHDPALLFWAIGFLGVLRLLEDYVIYPRLIRRGMKLHPFVVIVAVVAGAEIGGVAGIFLAVPVVAVASIAGRHWLAWLSDDETPERSIPRAAASDGQPSARRDRASL